tara:strand:- start:164 stop:340 length:177 start_codon:yes stop_codon:yes gene_type:complete
VGHVDFVFRHLLQCFSLEGSEKVSDNLILIIGIFCTALTILGAIMTIQEFKKQSDGNQ